MRAIVTAMAALMCLSAVAAQADEKYPSRPITILIGYPPGGSVDLTSRALAPVLERILGQAVLVVNKPGAAAAVGTQQAAHAAPDGYTITVATTQLALLPAVDKVFGRPPIFTREDFRPIARISADPSMIYAHTSQPWKTIQELIDDAKRRPNQIVYASGGLYGTTHLAIEIFQRGTATKMRHLPTSGGGPALTAVLGNHAALLAAHPGVGGPQARAGKLRPLVTLGKHRVETFPDIPTLKEAGYGGEYYQWNGVFVPAKVPEAIVKTLREAVAKAVKEPDFVQAMTSAGSGISYQDAEEFRAWWDEDSRTTEEIVRAIGKVQ